MTLVSYVPTLATVQSTTLHTANFQLKNPISNDGKIYIYIPTNVQVLVTADTQINVVSAMFSSSYTAYLRQEQGTAEYYIEINDVFVSMTVPDSATTITVALMTKKTDSSISL